MKFIKRLGLITLLFLTINAFSMLDSLKWSVGYGTLYGGGVGIKCVPFTLFQKKVKFLLGTSIGLLPMVAHESIKNVTYINVYQNLNKQIVFDKESIDKIYRGRYIIPFSINISYSLRNNIDFMLGYGTLSRVYAFEKLRSGFLTHLHAVEIYKLSAINISFLYRYKKYYGAFSYSCLFNALRYFDESYFTYYRNKFSYSKESFTLTLSFGYYIRR